MTGRSFSVSKGIARGFMLENLWLKDMFKPKTLIKVINPTEFFKMVDVSWISPFPGEQELIVVGGGIVVLSPESFAFDMDISIVCRA